MLSVLIDDEFRGNTPPILGNVETGAYRVTFSRPDYANYAAPVLVEPGKSTEMSVMLTPLAGSFDITTDLAGALAIFDTGESWYYSGFVTSHNGWEPYTYADKRGI